MLQDLHFDADLIITLNNVSFLLVADGSYVVVNFKEHQDLDQFLKITSELAPPSASPKPPSLNPLAKLNELNAQVRDMGLVLEIRVGNKTYVVLGSGNSASIKAAAIFGKIGSFFGR